MLEGNHPLNEIKEEIKQEIIHGESSSVYVSAEILEDAGSNSAAARSIEVENMDSLQVV
jgi:hypothetical protein